MIRCTVTECNCKADFPDMGKLAAHLNGKKEGRYRVADKRERTFKGETFASKTECTRAFELEALKERGDVIEWFAQPKFFITEGWTYRADFIVWGYAPDLYDRGPCCWIEDVKGHEKDDFRKLRRWWKANGRMPLVVLKRKGGQWDREVIRGPQPGTES